MIVELLEIEDLQYVHWPISLESRTYLFARRRFNLKYSVVTKETATLIIDIVDRRAAIRRRLQAVREIQAVYMPSVPKLAAFCNRNPSLPSEASPPLLSSGTATRSSRKRTAGAKKDTPERQPIFLPHELGDEDLETCVLGLGTIEDRLREGQMRSALDSLRVQLHVRSRLITFKARNHRGQRENQRSREKIEGCEAKIKQLVAKYRTARTAKLTLLGPGDWECDWSVLADGDVRGLSEAEPQVDGRSEPLSCRQQTTEGGRVLSWIWISASWGKDSSAASIPGMAEGASDLFSIVNCI